MHGTIWPEKKCGAVEGSFSASRTGTPPELLNAFTGATTLKQKEPRKVLQQLKHYVFPENPVDTRVVARLKRGAIHYAQVHSWWPLPPVQRWIRNHRFQFCHGANGSSTRVAVSGADITHLWVADEVLIEQVYQLDAVPFTPDLVLDLGANIGLFTLLAAKRWPTASLVCVEPHPTTFSFLCDNLALNEVNATKLQCALDADVSMKFMENDGAVFQALSDRATPTRVMTLKLDSLLPPGTNEKLLIKMDIEGSELTVLENLQAKLPQECFVFIELHQGDEALRWIVDWAARNQFQFRQIRRRDEAIDGFLMRTRGATDSNRQNVDALTDSDFALNGGAA
jgi:FkbM family methyltransferase